MSEQTLFTIAHDIATFKEYSPNELIVAQDVMSVYNISRMKSEYEAKMKLIKRDDEFIKMQRQFLKDKYPKTQEIWDRHEEKQAIKKVERELKQGRYQAMIEGHPVDQEEKEKRKVLEAKFKGWSQDIYSYYDKNIKKMEQEKSTGLQFF